MVIKNYIILIILFAAILLLPIIATEGKNRMTTTTEYGTWQNITGQDSIESMIAEYVAGMRVPSTVQENMASEYRRRINSVLPSGVQLSGNIFYGPVTPTGRDLHERSEIREAVESVNFDSVIYKYI